MVHGKAAWLFYTLRYSWQLMMFPTAVLLFSLLLSVVFRVRSGDRWSSGGGCGEVAANEGRSCGYSIEREDDAPRPEKSPASGPE